MSSTKAAENALFARWRRTSGCASATTNYGRPARRSPRHWTHCSGKLHWRACAPRFRWTARFASRRADSAESLRELAAGIVIGLLAAGAAAWVAPSFGLLGEGGDWRTAVVEYTNLYTNETFSPLNPDASLEAIELSALGAKVGANLTPENVALPGLRFTVAFMLSFEGSPLGVIAYVDPSGAPVLLCIIANRAPDAPMRSERRGDLSLAWWSRGGRSHLVIGRIPEERAVALARTLEKRV